MKKVLLVVDDNRVSRLLPGLILHSFSEQIQVVECEKGSDALRLLDTDAVSHVLLDISMPDFNGIQVAKTIGKMFTPHAIRLIAYTADVRAMNDEVIQSAGFDDVLLKPLQREDLLRLLDIAPQRI